MGYKKAEKHWWNPVDMSCWSDVVYIRGMWRVKPYEYNENQLDLGGSELACVFCLLQVIELPLNQVCRVACATIAKAAHTTCVLMLSSVPHPLTMGICVATTNMQQIFVSSNFLILLFLICVFLVHGMDEVAVWNDYKDSIWSLAKLWPELASLSFLSI